jgi:signal transduction histidine kinase
MNLAASDLPDFGLTAVVAPALRRLCDLLSIPAAALLIPNAVGDLTILATVGLTERADRPPLPGSDPTSTAMLRGDAPLWIDSAAETSISSPLRERPDLDAWAVLPVRSDGTAIALLHAGFPAGSLSTVDRGLLELAADHLGLAIGHQWLCRSEERARADLESGRQRLSFLADASALLSTSLDYQETLRQVTRLLVPRLCELCSVVAVEPDGSVNQIAVHGVDPARAQALHDLQARYALRPGASSLVRRVLSTGQSEFLPVATDEILSTMTSDPAYRELVRKVLMRSIMIVPLNARGRTIGSMALISGDPARRFTSDELRFTEDLAQRTAMAIDNSRLYQRAQEIAQVQEEFISIASHELKTPLTTIKGYVQLLLRQVSRPDPSRERMAPLLDELDRQVRRLEELVSDLLDVSRIEQGRLELRVEPMDLVQLGAEVVLRFESAPERTPAHQLVLDAPATVTGVWDPARLDQVITNLLSNALKYSPDGGEVRLSIRQAGDVAEITVSDQGIGFASSERHRLFQPFMRGLGTPSTIGGTGLGLYIARRIVERHGGTITGDGAPGRGATFCVRVPLAGPDTRRD